MLLALCPPINPTSTISLKCIDKKGNEISCQEATEGTYLSYTCADFYETPFGYKKTLTCSDGSWNYPNPVCQPAAHCVTNDYGDALSKENYLVGAGKIYNKYNDTRDKKAQYLQEGGLPSDELRTLEIPYKYETTCAQELPRDWADKYNTIDKICAGFYNKNISVCKGDSGSGLFFKNSDDNRYYVHGVVSLGVSHNGECDIQQNSLYTKVAFYYEYVDRALTKYSIKDCLLPPYPENGEWIIENKDKKPGDSVPSNTVLKIICKHGFHISSGGSAIKCDSSYNMPKCQLTCPELNLPPTAVYQCTNKDGKVIHCSEATEYTTLTYTCPEGFMAPRASSNSSQCVEDRSIKIICVYDSWRYHTGVQPEDLNTSLCTHVIYDIGLSHDGNLQIRNDARTANITNSFYERVTDIKEKNKNLKVLLSVEGNGLKDDDEYPTIASSPSKRDTFINNSKYALLLQELKTALKQHGWLFTATVYAGPTFLGYDVGEMNKVWDDEQKNPYKLSGNKWLGYDDKESVHLKAAFVKQEKYRGVSVWPVDGDDVLGKCGPKQILLKHVHAGLGNTVNLD
ncbi:hypothetical protein NQ314_004886 [Rhamnusium bicolor]|uniref:Uncharacterized protein n=1 Tax=Rhamnusium bicolor TaxID=1586634 RepID=A0AAV8ZK66_9CUCU|nr:hypothetical protein NQ314_004886 [Rhamnusium bicolor]